MWYYFPAVILGLVSFEIYQVHLGGKEIILVSDIFPKNVYISVLECGESFACYLCTESVAVSIQIIAGGGHSCVTIQGTIITIGGVEIFFMSGISRRGRTPWWSRRLGRRWDNSAVIILVWDLGKPDRNNIEINGGWRNTSGCYHHQWSNETFPLGVKLNETERVGLNRREQEYYYNTSRTG